MMESSLNVLDSYAKAFRDIINAKVWSSSKTIREFIVDPENWTAIRPSTRMVIRRIQNGDKEESYERI